jgi:hypothetical protein
MLLLEIAIGLFLLFAYALLGHLTHRLIERKSNYDLDLNEQYNAFWASMFWPFTAVYCLLVCLIVILPRVTAIKLDNFIGKVFQEKDKEIPTNTPYR